MAVVKETLADQTYRELRARIISGAMPGDMRILPNEIAADLGISPTPVKEACKRLEAEGLILVSARRSMAVRRLSMEDVRQLYDARIILETGAVEFLFDKGAIDDSLISRLRSCAETHEKYSSSSSLDDLTIALRQDRELHLTLVAASGLTLIREWHERLVLQTHTLFQSINGNYAQSALDHREIVDALAARDRPATIAALEGHLGRSRENTLIQVSSR
jgi:DNA-binding GntR family transcriptional regulator